MSRKRRSESKENSDVVVVKAKDGPPPDLESSDVVVVKEQEGASTDLAVNNDAPVDSFGLVAQRLDVIWPRLYQSNSDAVKRKEASPGDILIPITGELVESFLFVPVLPVEYWTEVERRDGRMVAVRRHLYTSIGSANIRWVEQDSGYKKCFLVDSAGNKVNEIQHEIHVYGIAVNEDFEPEYPICLSLGATKIKPFTRYMSRVRYLRGGPQLYNFVCRASSQYDERAGYYVYKFEPAGGSFDESLTAQSPELVSAVNSAAPELRRLVNSYFGSAPNGSGDADESEAPF